MSVLPASNIVSVISILVFNVVQGTLTPNGNVTVDCGSTRTFTCVIPGEPIKWTTSGLSGIRRGPFLARFEAYRNPRITSPDGGSDTQTSVSRITISGFNKSDNGGAIQCVNANNSNVRGMASIIVVGLCAPANVIAKAESCNTVLLQWEQSSETNDITTSVSCTPPSPGCAECTTSPCTITGLNPSTEYEFTVTLNSVMCGTSMNTTRIGTRDLRAPTNVAATAQSCDTVTLQWTQPSEPNDITTSVSCTPPSPGCAGCTTSPCTITGLNPSTEYVFTVTLNSGGCRASMNPTTARTMGLSAPVNVMAKAESCNTVILQWDQPSEPNDITTSVSCTPPSPSCSECTTSPCTITSLNPSTEYEFTVTLNSGGCRASMNTTEIVEIACKISGPTCISQSCTSQSALLLAGIIPTVVLLLVNIISVVVVFLITRHCYKKTSQKSSPSKGEDVYEQVEGPKTYEDIVMTDSPAYGPVK